MMIPNINGKIKHGNQTTNQILFPVGPLAMGRWSRNLQKGPMMSPQNKPFFDLRGTRRITKLRSSKTAQGHMFIIFEKILGDLE